MTGTAVSSGASGATTGATGAPGRLVAVTGAASGMGAACARRLAPSAGRLVLSDVSPEVAALAASLRSQVPGGAVEAVRCDLSEPAGVDELVARAGQGGGPFALVHAAGVSPTMGTWQHMFEVDLVASARVVDAFGSLAAPSSVAVLFASSAGHQLPQPPDPALVAIVDRPLEPDLLDRLAEASFADHPDTGAAYSWAKLGVLLLVQRSAAAWGAKGARICSVSPGIIDTPMGRLEMANQPLMEPMLDLTPLGRQGAAEEVASVVEFLCSEGASYMTGCDVLVDGGVVPALRRALG